MHPPIRSRSTFRLRILAILLSGSLISAGAAENKPADASAQYQAWGHTGSMYILTTPEGAHLPATASEDGFPLLVRLNKDVFDFSQAKPHGEDIRFSTATGAPLAYQVEEWDPANGVASIWVRIPNIKGNARQEMRMYWGRTDAESESNGKAVFNESNGFVSVLHMTDPAKDEVGAVQPKDMGTSAAVGMIGKCRHFPGKKGIHCGDNITTLPSGNQPFSTEAWFRAEAVNPDVVAWGKQGFQHKVVMQLVSPPHMKMDCNFGGGGVEGAVTVPKSRWVHVAHTYGSGQAKLYVNGVLDGTNKGGAMNISNPATMQIGGSWISGYSFVGDIDEVSISKVVRSSDWIRLEYENQKSQQTLVGVLMQAGSDFSVSEMSVTVMEGKTATLSAKAGGAQKIYWIIKKDGLDTIAAVDRLNFTVDAGRVLGDQALTLQLKAVFADTVKTLNIPVKIREDIPDPVFSLKAPATWDGRETIEIVPQVSNLEAMQAKGASELKYRWTASGLATIKEVVPGKLLLKRSQNSGTLTVKLVLSNGGEEISSTATIAVKEPEKDPWVQRTPEKDEKPVDHQFYARDEKNEGTLYYNGTLTEAAGEVFLKVYADEKLIGTEWQKPGADKAYAFTIKLKPGLIKYKVEFGTKTGGTETMVRTANDLVCGDAYLIDGQSNALATDTREESPRDTSEWIRSYADPRRFNKDRSPNGWCNPVWKAAQKEHLAELGWWGMDLAKRLVESQKMPIFMINAAVGGTRIDMHQRNEANPIDLETIYGRMLWRVREAKLTHGIRAVLWHQGENDQGTDGPDGGYGWESYERYFIEMSAAWKRDFPNIQHYYIFQIWPDSCAMGGGNGDMLREVQRSLPRLYSHMDILSTLGIKPPGPAHFPLKGWSEFARMVQPLIERDFYGRKLTAPMAAPNLKQAWFTGAAKDAIALEFDQPVVWKDSLVNEFYLDGKNGKVAAGSVSGNVLTLKLKEASNEQAITYLHEMSWSQERLLIGENGIAALTFCKVPILVRNTSP